MTPKSRPLILALLAALLFSMAAAALPAAEAAATASRNYKLSGDAPAFSDVEGSEVSWNFRRQVGISPDGKYAVFWADFSTEDAYDLHSVPLDGSAPPTRISHLHNTSTRGEFKITPDSSRVIYSTYDFGSKAVGLYSVPIGGGTVTPLSSIYSNAATGAQGMQDRFEITADSAHVIYLAEVIAEQTISLYSVPVGGGPQVRLSPQNLAVDVLLFRLTADGSRVIFSMDTDRGSLFSATSDGGALTPLVNNLVVGRWLDDPYGFVVSADGRVFYIIQRVLPARKTLYNVSAAGGVATIVHADVGDKITDHIRMAVSPDGQQVAVNVWDLEVTPYTAQLYVLPAAGGSKTPLHYGALSSVGSFRFSPGSDRLIYYAQDYGSNLGLGLYSAPVDGSGQTTLVSPADDPYSYRITPDGARVVYSAGYIPTELFSKPLGGGAPTPLSAPMPSGSFGIETFDVTPDGKHAVYLAPQQSKSVYELYRVPVGGGELEKVNRPLAGSGVSFYGWAVSPDGSTIIYVADQDVADKDELFATRFESAVFLPYIEN